MKRRTDVQVFERVGVPGVDDYLLMLAEVFVIIEEGTVVCSVYHHLLIELEDFDEFYHCQARELESLLAGTLVIELFQRFHYLQLSLFAGLLFHVVVKLDLFLHY